MNFPAFVFLIFLVEFLSLHPVAFLVQYRYMCLADFLVLNAVQVASGKPFGSEDYMALTPEWSVYGAAEGGFDPQETRVKKERRHGTADSGGCT